MFSISPAKQLLNFDGQKQYKICVSGAANIDICCPNIKELAERIGKTIVSKGGILLTGATTGVPYYVAKTVKEAGGISIGFSPASSKKEHLKRYHLPVDYFDLIVYTGFDYAGRNLILTKAADAVLIVCGRTGTLNEFTIAFETGIPIGVLQGSGGSADLIQTILAKGYRPKTKIFYDVNPEILVEKMIKFLDSRKRK